MRTAERAVHIANAAAAFPMLGGVTADALTGLVHAELGHAEILDAFQPVGDLESMALAPGTILHVISGNTAHAGLQSLMRGLLLGAHNRCKVPSAGLPEIEAFRGALPEALAASVEIANELSDAWLRDADAVIVFGSDETIHAFRKRVRPDQKFVAHGHRISFGILYEKPDAEAAALAARDASLFDQQGCLSPHLYYVGGDVPEVNARAFAADLAVAMEAFNGHTPRGDLGKHEANEITQLRSSYEFRAANDDRVHLWCSEGSTAWTVAYEDEPQFAVSPLNRFVFVKPLPDDLAPHLLLVRPHLSSVAVWPYRDSYPDRAASLGASRVCRLGNAQDPSLFWHQDGGESLAPLVSWIDREP